jgi:Tol biopolymer transport system component
MAATGGAARALAGWDGYQAFNPVVSPDGRTVLFQSDRSGNFDIWAVPLDGGEPVPFAASPLDDTGPQYSPDGSQVLFTSDRAGSDDVWVMPSAGGEAEQLTDWPSSESKARWSPDGSLIAFVSNRDATQGDVWIVPADGGEATRLTTRAGITNDMSAPAPAWAPDGGSIYYIGATSTGARDLYQVPVSGGSPRALGASPRIGFGALSPDGAWYAYATLEEGWAFVEVISTAGGTPRRLTTRTERVYQIADAWSPDGAYLVVEDYDLANDDGNLWTVTWPDGVWQPLTQTPDVAGFLAGTISFTPDGRQVVFSALRYFSNIMSVSVADLLAGDGRE